MSEKRLSAHEPTDWQTRRWPQRARRSTRAVQSCRRRRARRRRSWPASRRGRARDTAPEQSTAGSARTRNLIGSARTRYTVAGGHSRTAEWPPPLSRWTHSRRRRRSSCVRPPCGAHTGSARWRAAAPRVMSNANTSIVRLSTEREHLRLTRSLAAYQWWIWGGMGGAELSPGVEVSRACCASIWDTMSQI